MSELFQTAIERRARSIVLGHNHPTGGPAPSDYDLTLTKDVLKAGRTPQIPLLDHVIVANERSAPHDFFSLKAHGFLPN